jgi:hypothetical protein
MLSGPLRKSRPKILDKNPRQQFRTCIHGSSIQATRLRFCSVTFLPSLLANFLLKEFAEPRASLVKLRLRITDGATHNVGNLVVFVTLDIVKNKHGPIPWGKLLDGAFEVNAIDGTRQSQIRGTDVSLGATVFGIGL